MITRRADHGILLVGVLATALAACSPTRALEAARVLGDIAAGGGPSALKSATPPPQRSAVAYRVDGRAYAGDVYRPGEAAHAALVLVPGVAEAGKDDPRLVAFAHTLARARFTVLVPDIGALRELKIRAEDARDIADAVVHLTSAGGEAPDGRVGVAAISYAVGPALIAALKPGVAQRVDFFVGIGGYYDIKAAVRFFTTGYYRARRDEAWRHRQPNVYGKWVFVLSNLGRIDDADDRATLEAMARRKLDDPGAEVAGLAADLGPEGRAVYDLVTNTDPERVGALIAHLPADIRAEMRALDLALRDLGRLGAHLLLVHGRQDNIIPYTESRALAAAVPEEQVDLYVISGLGHVESEPEGIGKLQLWRAVYRLLEIRDGGATS